jgi:HEAT repeat protein
VRRKAATALGQLGDARVVEPLIAALTDADTDVRSAAVAALGQVGDARAVEPLIAALGDHSSNVREFAAEELGKFADNRAAMPLFSLARSDKNSAKSARDALERLLERLAESIRKDDLLAIVTLNDVVGLYYYGCGDYAAVDTRVFDCSRIRQLARQELIRRGVKA